MNSTTKRIVVAFRLAGEPGRRKLDGFLRYMAENRLDWQVQFVRIEAVSRRLVATNDTPENIALSCGFRKLDRLRTAFKKHFGLSMVDYRTQAKSGH